MLQCTMQMGTAASRIDCIIDGIILDVDGTIWDTTQVAASAWNKAIGQLALDVPAVDSAMLRREFGKPMDEIALDLWPHLEDGLRERLMILCQKEEQRALEDATITAYPGVVQTVRQMAAAHDFFVVSNCQSGYIELMMERTGLSPYIKDFECFGRTGKGKAANIALLASRNQLSHPVYVGDTRGDALCCQEVGLPFVWASWGFGCEEDFADVKIAAKIDSFDQLTLLFGGNSFNLLGG